MHVKKPKTLLLRLDCVYTETCLAFCASLAFTLKPA